MKIKYISYVGGVQTERTSFVSAISQLRLPSTPTRLIKIYRGRAFYKVTKVAGNALKQEKSDIAAAPDVFTTEKSLL
jgi:hypothetical protein